LVKIQESLEKGDIKYRCESFSATAGRLGGSEVCGGERSDPVRSMNSKMMENPSAWSQDGKKKVRSSRLGHGSNGSAPA
jgi:hypothetical protein